VDEEMGRFYVARERARVELQGLYEMVEKRAGKEEAVIFAAHQEMLSDPALEGRSVNMWRSV
jgi:phosphoenolpyruvate-protein kinase (PTS system EI component)